MKNITIFSTDAGNIHVINKDHCPWFFVKEICNVMDITDSTKIIKLMKSLLKEEKIEIITAEGSDGNLKDVIVNYVALCKLLTLADSKDADHLHYIIQKDIIPDTMADNQCDDKMKTKFMNNNEIITVEFDFGYW